MVISGGVLLCSEARMTRGYCPRNAPITLEMAKGCLLYMVKAVMNGRADEVVDLAKSNLWR
jgi:pyruvate dehydrogenase (quinone)